MKSAAAAYGIELRGTELALACQWVENVIAGSACGIMDQICRGEWTRRLYSAVGMSAMYTEDLIQLPEQLKIWGIDSGVSHQVSGIEYEAARASGIYGL